MLKTAKNPYSAHEPPAPEAAFFEPRLDCRFHRFAFCSFRSCLAFDVSAPFDYTETIHKQCVRVSQNRHIIYLILVTLINLIHYHQTVPLT